MVFETWLRVGRLVGNSPPFYESPLRVKCFFCVLWVAVVIPIFYPSVAGVLANASHGSG